MDSAITVDAALREKACGREERRNRYEVKSDAALRHPIERHRSVSALLALVLDEP
jgi:hypothetical protein